MFKILKTMYKNNLNSPKYCLKGVYEKVFVRLLLSPVVALYVRASCGLHASMKSCRLSVTEMLSSLEPFNALVFLKRLSEHANTLRS